MTFYVGQKVVCVNDSLMGVDPRNCPGGTYCPQWPIKGLVYTVREIENSCLRLVEVVNPIRDFGDGAGEARFRSCRFRPLVENRKTVSFTAGAPIDSEKWDGRRKVKERI